MAMAMAVSTTSVTATASLPTARPSDTFNADWLWSWLTSSPKNPTCSTLQYLQVCARRILRAYALGQAVQQKARPGRKVKQGKARQVGQKVKVRRLRLW